MAENKKLPLKVVPRLEKDFYRPEASGGPKKVFTKVTPEFRQKLSSEVIGIRDHFSPAFKQFPKVPAVARVRVREDAIAKSHRPTDVFTASTCPIIGAEGLGDSATERHAIRAGVSSKENRNEHFETGDRQYFYAAVLRSLRPRGRSSDGQYRKSKTVPPQSVGS
jgi:hypothetical protein